MIPSVVWIVVFEVTGSFQEIGLVTFMFFFEL